MRRRRRGGPAQQAEACGVWLDTAELKQRAAQSLRAKPRVPSRVLEWKQASAIFTQPGASQLRTRQTTISAFFSTQTDEKDKENSRPSPFIPSKGCKEKGLSLAACPMRILALPREEAQKCPSGAGEQLVQVTAQRAPSSPPFRDSSLSQAESRKESELLAGETVSARNRDKKPQQSSSVDSSIGFAATENINPAVRRDGTWAVGVCSSPQRAQPLREHSWNAGSAPGGRAGSCGQLFTQDSQGNRVISHRSLPPPGSPGEQQAELGYEFLFTQDSEGNRVIKHWLG
ncbi:aurora kinase A and ninein-interacting protein-like isoform X3 [Apus apus]|uniref:aurora kinase A and ninein-interacting protein-like isoform X3 n=2 Tax=Apus apus TaxID=8895 RepID=UPI0021F8295D|nr:aurora kinase A and ninein-interacting protein-like isoform X3 [Apus apus]